MASKADKIIYTKTDEAPMLATFSFLPIINAFTKGNDLVIQDENNRLFRYDGTSFNTPYQPEVFDKGRISAVISLTTDTILLTTIDRGIFYLSVGKAGPWKTQDDTKIRANIIYCAVKAGSDGIVLGTSFGGVTILNNHKQLSYLIGKENGLPNNTILSVCGTQDGNVWVRTDNGIALINFSAPVRFIYPDVMLEGTGYDAAYHQDKLYLGTNTGLYSINWKKYYSPEEKSHFQKVSESSGQVWDLQVLKSPGGAGADLEVRVDEQAGGAGGPLVDGVDQVGRQAGAKVSRSPATLRRVAERGPSDTLTVLGAVVVAIVLKVAELGDPGVGEGTRVRALLAAGEAVAVDAAFGEADGQHSLASGELFRRPCSARSSGSRARARARRSLRRVGLRRSVAPRRGCR